LGLGETLSLNAQIGTLLDNVSFGFTEPYLLDKPIQAGFTVFYQRYSYDQGQQQSVLYGQNLIPYYNAIGNVGCAADQPNCNLLNYVMNGRGFTTFLSHPLRRSFARIGLSYSYSVNNIDPITEAAKLYFYGLDFTGIGGPNSLEGIDTSMITPTYAYNTVNHPIVPTKGLRVNFTVGFAGSFLGGNVNTIQPAIDMAYFRKGFFKGHVMGFHNSTRFITGYGGKVAPPYSRYYMGGETDVRGFDILTISPIAYLPTETSVTQYNGAGVAISNPIVPPGGTVIKNPATTLVPGYQLLLPGGDTYSVFNYEYRVPIFGPVTLAYFLDAGVDLLLVPSQLGLNPARLTQLEQEFPSTAFSQQAVIAPGTQKPRVSTGLELQVLMPVVNAPFRLYWAYNLSYVTTNLVPPIVFTPGNFTSEATYQAALATLGGVVPYHERHSLFRFSVGRTF
jgi:outer membrane protein insertion porin family